MRRTLTVLLACLALLAPAGAAAAQPNLPDAAKANARGYYLQLGDSLAAGYQPTTGDDPAGGYADDVLAAIQQEQPKTTLVNLACSGETTQTMVDGGRCDYPKGSQLDQALHFLHAHGKFTRTITVIIGANDVVSCYLDFIENGNQAAMQACLETGLGAVAQNLPVMLAELSAAAPDAEIVVLNYYNALLAAWLLGPEGQALATMSMPLHDQLNGLIAAAAASAGAELADVAAAFDSDNLEPVATPLGPLPTNVATICALTWMCTDFFDIHANDAGYAVLGRAVTG